MGLCKGLLLTVLLALGGLAEARLNVAATTANMGMLARTVGGDAVQVRVLASPDQNAHYLEARPSMMAALRRADLLVSVGAELEIGWLPPAIRGAANPRIQPGQPGYFEAAAQVRLLDEGKPADRRLGDVHPAGNPHIYFDPVRLAAAGEALAGRLAQLDPANAAMFRANAAAFTAAVDARLPGWLARAAGSAGVVLYHKDADYLADRLAVPVLGYLEPVPGVPPTAAHLRDLVARLRGLDGSGTIVHASYEDGRGGRFLGQELGWPVRALPTNVGVDADAAAYFGLIDAWVEAFATS